MEFLGYIEIFPTQEKIEDMGDLTMSEKEIELISLMDRHLAGFLKLKDISQRIGLSVRQLIRKKKRYLKEGKKGLISKKRGHTSNRAYDPHVKKQVITLLKQERYGGFKPTFAAEIVERELLIKISDETIRQWMIEYGLWIPKQRGKSKIYQRRERRERFGELIQLDGSPEDWFEGRAPSCTLLMAIDDATGIITSGRFEEQETTRGYFLLMKAHLEKYGRPLTLYPDKYGVFKVNRKSARQNTTQFTRAMKQLGISVVCAHSPQAKGRIERSFRTHQDRLIKEMRLAGISSIEEANRFLLGYISKHNAKFSIAPKDPTDAHEPLNPNHNLQRILAIHESRKISKNLEISWQAETIQIQAPGRERRLIGNRATVIETLNGDLLLEFESKPLTWKYHKELPADEAPVLDTKELAAAKERVKRGQHRSTHPWRQPSYRRRYRRHSI